MKLDCSQSNFGDYRIARRHHPRWRRWLGLRPAEEILDNVLTADDQTGLVVRQQVSKIGEPLYINAAGDTVIIDNVLKVLLLVPDIRVHFLREFVPKTEQTFVEGLSILRINVTEAPRLPENLDGEEVIIMKGGYDG